MVFWDRVEVAEDMKDEETRTIGLLGLFLPSGVDGIQDAIEEGLRNDEGVVCEGLGG